MYVLRGGLISTEPSRKARKGKTLPITKDRDRQDLLLTGPTPPTPADSDQGSQTGTTIHEGLNFQHTIEDSEQ